MSSSKTESRDVMMRYRYRALLQSVDIVFFRKDLSRSFEIICEAELKLPLLKKTFTTSTEFLDSYSDWVQHSPVLEKGAEKKIIRREQIESQDAIDPVGFFMLLNASDWNQNSVHLLIGAKTVQLDVNPVPQGFEVRRREKEQRIIVKKDAQGIQKIEIPVPVIGNVVVERVP